MTTYKQPDRSKEPPSGPSTEGVFLNKPLPSSEESERVLLGAILLDNSLISQAVGQLEATDFYSPLHKKIYGAMLKLFTASKKIDPILIGEELKKEGTLESIGGIATITNLTYGLPHFSGLQEYTKVVKDKATTRRLIRVCTSITTEALAESEILTNVLDRAEQSLYDLRNKSDNHSELIDISTSVTESFNDWKERQRSENVQIGLLTGIKQIDEPLSGLQKKQLIIVGGRPSQGKSTLALNIIDGVTELQPQSVVALFTMEMSKKQVTGKMICARAEVDYTRFRQGFLTREEAQRVAAASVFLSERRIVIDESSTQNITSIRAKIRRIVQMKKRLDLVVIDYLQMMEGAGSHENRQQEVAQISKNLKQMAKDFDVPIVAVCSLNRGSEARKDKRPQMSDLRESGQIESDADVIVFVHRPEMYATEESEKQYQKGKAELIVAKNREGETGLFHLGFMGNIGKFV